MEVGRRDVVNQCLEFAGKVYTHWDAGHCKDFVSVRYCKGWKKDVVNQCLEFIGRVDTRWDAGHCKDFVSITYYN